MSEEPARQSDAADNAAGGQAAHEGAAPQITFEEVCNAIRPVKDPEIGLSIVELGLLYGHEYDPATRHLKVKMTLTSQMCPAGPEIIGGVKFLAGRMENVDDAEVELVWSPPWDPKIHCSEDAKAILGIWD